MQLNKISCYCIGLPEKCKKSFGDQIFRQGGRTHRFSRSSSFLLLSPPSNDGTAQEGRRYSHTHRVQVGEQWFVCSVLNVSPHLRLTQVLPLECFLLLPRDADSRLGIRSLTRAGLFHFSLRAENEHVQLNVHAVKAVFGVTRNIPKSVVCQVQTGGYTSTQNTGGSNTKCIGEK